MAVELSNTKGAATVATAPPSADAPSTGVRRPPPATHSSMLGNVMSYLGAHDDLAFGTTLSLVTAASYAAVQNPGRVRYGIGQAGAILAHMFNTYWTAPPLTDFVGTGAVITLGTVVYNRDSFHGMIDQMSLWFGSHVDNTLDTLNKGRDTFNQNTQGIKDTLRNAANSLSSAITGAGGAIGGAGGSLVSAAQSQLPLIVIVVLGGAYLRHRAS